MFKQRLGTAALLLGLVFGLGLVLGVLLPRWAGGGSKPATYNTATILRQVQTLSQLVTVKYVMEKVEVLEDPSQNVLRQMLPDNTRVILVAHGIVKAGVDLGQLKPEAVRVSGKRVTLALPRAQITDTYLDDNRTQIVEHTTGFLRTFNKDLEQTTRQNALDNIRRGAREAGILRDADERARAQLTSLFTLLGFESVEFTTK
jgi:hypothetical protein